MPSSAPQQGNRIGNRLRLDVPAALVLTHETRACLIDDISSKGARVRVHETLAKGRAAILTFHELRVYSSVMWSRQGECGQNPSYLL